MKYILDNNGYVESASCNPISCGDKVSQEYTGTIPNGYETLDEWILKANIRAYKIVDNNLVYDSAKDAELTALWQQQNGVSDLALTKVSSVAANAWKPLANNQTINLAAGTYLFIFSATIYPSDSTQTGLATIDAYMDGARTGDRATISLSKNLYTSGNIPLMRTYNEDVDFSLNLYAYSSIAFKIDKVSVQIMRLR
jgi:hypothetical protein